MKYLLILLLAGCATTYESDRYDPRYQSGGRAPYIGPGPHGADTAAFGTAVTAAALAANPDYYRGTLLKGKLVCTVKDAPAMDLACPTLPVVLRSPEGKEVARTVSEKGEFAFKVEKKLGYQLTVDSEQYVEENKKQATYQSGDAIFIRLSKK